LAASGAHSGTPLTTALALVESSLKRKLIETPLPRKSQGDDGECVMKCPIDRRTLLKIAGAAAVAVTVGPVDAQSAEIRGAVRFEGGAAIPKGHLEISLEDPAIQDDAQRRIASARIPSDGGSKTLAFTLPLPASSTAPPALRIVARLERADGWLVARGSAQFDGGLPVDVTLHEVMY
jgi:uncharacterized lipoprotein YbaY